jgi:hypothetical protein
VENADKWIAGFLGKFEEGVYNVVRGRLACALSYGILLLVCLSNSHRLCFNHLGYWPRSSQTGKGTAEMGLFTALLSTQIAI